MKLYTSKFVIGTDDAMTGTGFIPSNCPLFNASWSAVMLFHDVFEHWFEHQHKYFTGDAAENIGGEMCAMGALWYLHETFNITYRLPVNGYNSPTENVVASTVHFFDGDNYTYGSKLISNVPKQPVSESAELEYIIKKIFATVRSTTGEYTDRKEDFEETKKSGTFRKIADLHRYGYNMAAKMFPDNNHNYQFFVDFWKYWEQFFDINPDLESYIYDQLEISVHKVHGNLSWTAKWNGKRMPKNWPPDLYEFKIENELFY